MKIFDYLKLFVENPKFIITMYCLLTASAGVGIYGSIDRQTIEPKVVETPKGKTVVAHEKEHH